MNKLGKYLFLSIFIIFGIGMLFLGGNGIKNKKEQTENYIEVTGNYIDKTVYSSDSDGTTYSLIYSYTVDGRKYTVSTNYGTNVIPKIGSEKKIKYNPSNPNQAVILGFDGNYLILICGIAFVIVPIIILIKTKDFVTTNTSYDDFSNNNEDDLDYNNKDEDSISAIEDNPVVEGVINTMVKISDIYKIVFGLIFTGVSMSMLLSVEGMAKLFLVPFVVCGVAVIIMGVSSLKGKSLNLGNKIYIISFLTFWFGFLIVFDYTAIKDGNWTMVLFSLIFWVAGIFVAYKNFKNNG